MTNNIRLELSVLHGELQTQDSANVNVKMMLQRCVMLCELLAERVDALEVHIDELTEQFDKHWLERR